MGGRAGLRGIRTQFGLPEWLDVEGRMGIPDKRKPGGVHHVSFPRPQLSPELQRHRGDF